MSQSSVSEAAVPTNSSWRYGVYLFPLGPLSLLCSYAGLWLFARATDAESIGVGIAAFVATVLAGWLSYLFAAIVAIALPMDARALRDHPTWTPNSWLAVGVGIVHVAGAVLAVPYLLSVPAIAYYVYRRRQHVNGDGGDSGRESVESARDRPTLE